MSRETYISIDIETNGPTPGVNSMLSFAASAFDENGFLFSTFTRNLHEEPMTGPNLDTMEWWKKFPEAWEALQQNRHFPDVAMRDFAAWYEQLPGAKTIAAYPAGFDWPFIYYYANKYVKPLALGFSVFDMKTAAAMVLGLPFRKTIKAKMPRAWFGPEKHTHVALDDAIEQGRLLFKILGAMKALHADADELRRGAA